MQVCNLKESSIRLRDPAALQEEEIYQENVHFSLFIRSKLSREGVIFREISQVCGLRDKKGLIKPVHVHFVSE